DLYRLQVPQRRRRRSVQSLQQPHAVLPHLSPELTTAVMRATIKQHLNKYDTFAGFRRVGRRVKRVPLVARCSPYPERRHRVVSQDTTYTGSGSVVGAMASPTNSAWRQVL